MAKQLGFTHESTKNESVEWYTPGYIFDALGLTFDMDVASPGAEIVPWIPAERHLTAVDDGLITSWKGVVFCNPPYGNNTAEWVAKFSKHIGGGIMLVFARTDTKWFHDYAVNCDAFLFIRGRVKFIRNDGFVGGGCGAASMLIAKGDRCTEILRCCGLGHFVNLRSEQ